MRFKDRAERIEPGQIIDTFVSVGPMMNILESENHQVVYGRRGVGKTHALLYLADQRRREGDLAVYIDCRTLGSNISGYNDPSQPIADRATSLLIDVCQAIHNNLLEIFTDPDDTSDWSVLGPVMNEFSDSISEVRVVGVVENIKTASNTRGDEKSAAIELVTSGQPSATLKAGGTTSATTTNSASDTTSGVERAWIDFAHLSRTLQKVITATGRKRVWLMIDEWSAVALDLQPYLADLLNRTIFVINKVTVKIGAIEHRSRFIQPIATGGYVGLELGADMTQALNLDDYLVFDRDQERSSQFFRTLLSKHLKSTADELKIDLGMDEDSLVSAAFTQENVFREFVISTEGVPRDALHIIQRAGEKADDAAISMPMLVSAVLNFYQSDKYNSIQSNPPLRSLLEWVRDKVIGDRKTRAFLLPVGQSDEIINELFDRRALHILNRNMSAAHRPGERYVVYKIDYGCYVDLRATDRYRSGMLFQEQESMEELAPVPDDDARSFRRAILDLGAFYEDFTVQA